MSNIAGKLKQFPYTDILGWSVSRYDKFLLCKRQYYYDYYGKHDREFPRSRIDALKKMTSIPLEVGNVVHDSLKTLLERLLVSEKPIDPARFLAFARKKTEEYCSTKTFAEVYYREVAAVRPDAVFDVAEKCLSNFLQSERYAWILARALDTKQSWIIEPPGYGETRIDGRKAYCKVDFLFPVDGDIYILDWKTGKKDEAKHRKQLWGYATWAAYHFGADPATIVPVTVYLQPVYDEMKVSLEGFDAGEFAARVASETEEMYAFCSDSARNIPKDKSAFPQTEKSVFCTFCNYRELCAR
jgi:CRISPR/Cas system-associated exonuclease Cas4 (RecB family)